jgi:hypothetical protein
MKHSRNQRINGIPLKKGHSVKTAGLSLRPLNHLIPMIESIISAAVAVVTGGAVLTSRIHARILELDKRIDGVELQMAQKYVSKVDFREMFQRVEDQMLRIEDKIDKLVETRR